MRDTTKIIGAWMEKRLRENPKAWTALECNLGESGTWIAEITDLGEHVVYRAAGVTIYGALAALAGKLP